MGHVYHHKPEPLGTDRKICIATGSRSGHTAPAYQLSLVRTLDACKESKIDVEWMFLTGNCHVDDCRNYLVRDFLLSDCTHLFFVDSDVGWSATDFIRVATSPHDVCAGVYPKKRENTPYPVKFNPGEMWTDADGWMEVDKVPTGFLCIARHVLQDMYDAEPRKFRSEKQRHKMPQAILFERTYEGGGRISGDYSWCNRWRRLGGKIYIDPEMRFYHSGEKEYQGKLGHYLRQQNGLLPGYIASILEKLESGTYEPEVFLDLYEAWDNPRWSARPNLLAALAMILEEQEPGGHVLDVGSGLTTLVSAAIGKRKGLRVTSLEHSAVWLETVLFHLKAYPVNARLCSIRDKWYDFSPNGSKYTIVTVDGPPRNLYDRGGIARIQDCFADGCAFIVDDYNRPSIRLDGVILKPYDDFAVGVKQ